MNRLIQLAAAAGLSLLISAAAHRVRPVRAGCSFRAHPGFCKNAPLVTDDATDDDVYQAISGSAVEPTGAADSSEEEEVASRPRRARQLPARLRS
jgi:hypothetical protein